MGLKTTLTGMLAKSWTGDRVARGPFRGLRYPHTGRGSSFAHKLLGTYELELEPVVAEILTARPECVVNVGAREGYYAVGLARALPATRVIAFEAEAAARDLLAETARANEVCGRVLIEGACDVEDLRAVVANEAPEWLILDIEGAEHELLDPERIDGLAACSILVEVHERLRPGVTDSLRERFRPTHSLERIPTRERTLDDLPLPRTGWRRAVPDALYLKALDEKRGGPMEWFVLRPN